jgi:starvation-inducible outer membrane lipoprotein
MWATREEIIMRSIAVCLIVALGTGTTLAAESPKALLDPTVALDGHQNGAAVLWGGRVFSRADDAGHNCLEIASLPLLPSDGHPARRDRVREGQHFIVCGPQGFASAEHPVRSYLTIAGSVRGVEQRFVRRSCDYLIDSAGHRDLASARQPAEHGCTVSLPIVDVEDSRSWREDATPASAPML